MHSTPKSKLRPSLGDPTRITRSARGQSPGASSVASDDMTSQSPRRVPGRAGAGRLSVRGGANPNARSSRDPRPVGSKAYMMQCTQNILEVLTARGFPKSISHEKLLKDPACKDFFEVFRFLVNQIDPGLEVDGRVEDEVPAIMRRLKYPVEVNRSKLQAISGPNTWPQLLAVLDWLAVLVRISEGLVAPVALCEASLLDADGGDEENHVILRCIHENYVQFIHGREDKSDEEDLRRVYEERADSVQDEIGRLQECVDSMSRRLTEYSNEHERLEEMRRTPGLLEREAETLRSAILAMEARVQRVEAETTNLEAEERVWETEDQEVRQAARELQEQVQNQAYTKKDVERLKYERSRNTDQLKELIRETEKVEQDVWDLKQQETRRGDGIRRRVRQVNELLESLQDSIQIADTQNIDLEINLDLSEPNDALAAQDFSPLMDILQKATSDHFEAAQKGELDIANQQKEAATAEETLASKERECHHLRDRIEQLGRLREQLRAWSASQLQEARAAAEATEDAVHAVAVGTAAPMIRDSAEVDKLRLTLSAIKTQGATELQALREQLKRDEERFEDHRRRVLQQLEGYTKDTEAFLKEFETKIADESIFASARRAQNLSYGGC
mmetsp:Transcript_1643/g.3596  ORF Transcript_1643/g.3596 Transcript_1643/m.3596 type:complete len:619 (+) Transcript_1643:43-1899(+)